MREPPNRTVTLALVGRDPLADAARQEPIYMSSREVTLVLVGPNAGRSGSWNGRVFVRGAHRFVARTPDDAGRACHMMRTFYSAHEVETARLSHPHLFSEGGPYHGDHPLLGRGNVPPRREGVAAQATAQGDGATPDAAGAERPAADAGRGPERASPDEVELLDDGSVVVRPVDVATPADEDSEDADADLAAAIGTLDPENDKHWTSNNLPALDLLADRTGRRVTRADVEALAKGYNRAAARRAKAE